MAEDTILYPVRNQLKKHFGGRDKLYPFMELNTMDMVVFEDEFIEKLDTTFKWGIKNSGGSQTGTVASTNNGICRLTSGSSTDNYVYMFPNKDGGLEGAFVVGTSSPVMWVRLKVDVRTSVKIEMGFTDADDDAGASNVLATPSTTASDCAIWVYDTGDAGNATKWQGVYTKNTTSASKVEPAITLVAAQYEWVGVAIQGENVKFMHMDQYGNPDYESPWFAAGITSTDALIPWIGVHTRTNTNRLLDIDYIKVWQRRTTTDS